MEKEIRIRVRHWIYIDDMKFFGPGRMELLEHIQETGSIVKAAKAMKMSYKKAWAMVDAMNTYGQLPYVITHKGGQQGGGAELTDTGLRVISAYKNLSDKLLAVVESEKELLSLI